MRNLRTYVADYVRDIAIWRHLGRVIEVGFQSSVPGELTATGKIADTVICRGVNYSKSCTLFLDSKMIKTRCEQLAKDLDPVSM